MAAVATGRVSIIDVQDGQPLSCMISSNTPRIQVKNVNTGAFAPDWAVSNVVLTPVIVYGGTTLQLDDARLSYVVKRRIGAGAEENLAANEVWASHVLTISANTLDGAPASVISYVFHVTFTDPVTSAASMVDAMIDFALVQTGANGSAGAPGAPGSAGADAVRLTLYAPNGDVFQNQSGQLVLQAAAYVGITELTTANADFEWRKYSGGVWQTIAGQTGTSLTVNGSDVVGVQSYQCRMRYPKSTGFWYTDVYTITDKTDSYQAAIESTGGNTFRNGVGTAVMICRLWQNGIEVDPLKTTLFAQALPSTGLVTGIFCYLLDPTSPRVRLYRYSGSAWVDVTSDVAYRHTENYAWYRRDKNGAVMDGGNAFTATSLVDPKAVGKVIFIDGDDVEQKTVFTCEVA